MVALSNGDGSGNGINRYDEWGNADAADGGGLYGFFGFTGQFYLYGADLYDYKARMYSARLGRFMQTDPIGYADGMNWYNYAGSEWRQLPDEYGKWNSVFRRYRRWVVTDVFEAMLETLAAVVERDITADMIDSTVIPAHHCAVGMKKGIRRLRGSAVPEAASQPSCTPAAMVRADHYASS